MQADANLARQKLDRLAQRLGITLMEVPKFLEDFGDIFLSLSYYKSYLDDIQPKVSRFVEGLADLRGNWQMKQNRPLMKACDHLESKFNDLMLQTTGRFENFYSSTDDMWEDISAERFRQVEKLITSYHTTIGGSLCAMGCKMNAWNETFPTANSGGLFKRSEFIMTQMLPGIQHIEGMEDNAPMMVQIG